MQVLRQHHHRDDLERPCGACRPNRMPQGIHAIDQQRVSLALGKVHGEKIGAARDTVAKVCTHRCSVHPYDHPPYQAFPRIRVGFPPQRAAQIFATPKKRNARVGWVIDPAVGCGVRHIAGSMTQPTILLARKIDPPRLTGYELLDQLRRQGEYVAYAFRVDH